MDRYAAFLFGRVRTSTLFVAYFPSVMLGAALEEPETSGSPPTIFETLDVPAVGGSEVSPVKSTIEAPSSASVELGGASVNFSRSFKTSSFFLGALSDILGTETEKTKLKYSTELDLTNPHNKATRQMNLIRPFKCRPFTAFEANPEGAAHRPYLINSSSLTSKALGQGSFSRMLCPSD